IDDANQGSEEKGTIRISVRQEGEWAEIQLSDSGCGIPDEIQQKVFDPFFTTKDNGQGLGLATVFGAVRRHHGGIAMQSQPGNGTVFTVYFVATDASAERRQRVDAATGSDSLQRIAIVDDEPAVRKSLERILDVFGFSTVSFSSGDDAIAKFDLVRQCDAVLLDQQMPGTSGLDTYHNIRLHDLTMPVCFMSGYTTSAEVSTVVHNDKRCESIDKPFATDELLAKLRDMVSPNTVPGRPHFADAKRTKLR
ncbi:MAG: response regulator, partial [Pirellulaceae bacterium]|nr:response regulator [Pirellulaceae bacterium]